jgi:hypothetical protein
MVSRSGLLLSTSGLRPNQWGEHPMEESPSAAYPHAVKINHPKKALTFGEFVAGIYAACGRKKASGIVRLAVKARWVEFRGHDRFLIS